MYIATTIPEDVVDLLRQGARRSGIELLIELSELAERPTADQRPAECGGELRAKFERTGDLLDALGWEPSQAAAETVLDVGDHGLALYEALIGTLGIMLGQVRRADAPVRERLCGSVARLAAFASLLHSADLMREDHDGRLQKLEAEVGNLLACVEEEAEEPVDLDQLSEDARAGAFAPEHGRPCFYDEARPSA